MRHIAPILEPTAERHAKQEMLHRSFARLNVLSEEQTKQKVNSNCQEDHLNTGVCLSSYEPRFRIVRNQNDDKLHMDK